MGGFGLLCCELHTQLGSVGRFSAGIHVMGQFEAAAEDDEEEKKQMYTLTYAQRLFALCSMEGEKERWKNY